MKRISFSIGGAVFAVGVCLASGCSKEAPLALRPNTTEIVVAPDAVSVVRVAAAEAKEFLSQSLGTEIPVVNAPSEGKVSLVLGPNKWADAAGVTTNGLKRDAFRTKTVGKRVYILGIDDPNDAHKALKRGGIWLQNFQRATAFGVYDFLERFVGVRFYFPGELGTVVPRKTEIVLPPTDITIAPAMTVRRYSPYDMGEWFEGENAKELRHPMKTLNWWRLKMETEYTPCCHGSTRLKYMERFAKSHPEYFALLPDGRRHNSPAITHPGHPGQLCHTSKIWNEIYEDAKSYLRGEPASVRGIPVDSTLPNAPKKYGWGMNAQGGKYFDVMPQDGMIQCACPACQKVWDNVEDKISWASELIWGNVARLARRLKKEGVPGYVCNLAYSKYRHVPKCAIPDNVKVMVAERGPWTAADKAERKRELDEYAAWTKKIGQKVWAWNYANRGADGGKYVPQMTPKAVGEYYKTISPMIFGAFMESECAWSIFNYLNYYVFAKVMWDPTIDVNALLDEHHRLMFGPAAPEMKAFYELLEKLYIEEFAGKTFDTPLGPQSEKKSDYEVFTRIYSPAIIDRMEKMFVQAEKKVVPGSIEAKRVAFAKKNLFGPLCQRARTYIESIDVKKGVARDAASKAVNLIENGDFSIPKKGRQFGPWFGIAKGGITELDDKVYVSAPYSLRLRPDEKGMVTVSFYFKDKNGVMTMKKGQKYRLSYCIKLDALTPTKLNGGAGTTIWDNKNVWLPSVYMSGTQDWTYQVHEFTSDPNTGARQMPYIYLRVSNAQGTVWFDNVRLEEVQ